MVVIKLKEVIGTNQEINFINAISKFSCQDSDVESFLKAKAIEHEKRNKSRTFLLMDEKKFYNNELVTLGYFTLSLKALTFEDNVSKAKIKSVDGFSKNVSILPTILIGQFGKDKIFSKNISGMHLFEICLHTVYQVHNLIGGRIVLIECQNNNKIISFYHKNDFECLQISPDNKYLQMIRRL